MVTLTYACHTAHLDPMTGNGLLVLPRTDHDLRLDVTSLHAADWDHVMVELALLGWEPTEGSALTATRGTVVLSLACTA